jgi:hypothetical protein
MEALTSTYTGCIIIYGDGYYYCCNNKNYDYYHHGYFFFSNTYPTGYPTSICYPTSTC